MTDQGLGLLSGLRQLRELRLGTAGEGNTFTPDGFISLIKGLKEMSLLTVLEARFPLENELYAGKPPTDVDCLGMGDRGAGFVAENFNNLTTLGIRKGLYDLGDNNIGDGAVTTLVNGIANLRWLAIGKL